VTAVAALRLDAHPAERAAREISLLVGNDESGAARVGAACAFGALTQPIANGWLDLDNADVRMGGTWRRQGLRNSERDDAIACVATS
jgi:hypothetical protein